jgi:hypothetical protein
LALVIGGALLLASAALYLTVAVGDPLRTVFRQVLTIEAMAALVVWSAIALLARWLIVGRLPKLHLTATGVVWSVSRLVCVIAAVLLLIGWLGTLALRLPMQVTFARAAILLIVATGFTGIANGAFLNSKLALSHWRARSSQ